MSSEGELRLCELPDESWPGLKRFYRSHSEKVRFFPDDRVLTLELAGNVIAAVRLSSIAGCDSDQVLWMRNLLVAKAYRKQGYAQRLLSYVIQAFESAHIWIMAKPELKTFYRDLGFQTAELADAPESLAGKWRSYTNKAGQGVTPYVLMVRAPNNT